MNCHYTGLGAALRVSRANRRAFLRCIGVASGLFAVPGALAKGLMQTPAQGEGPFYPDHLPLDTDNDLLVINDASTAAAGDVTWLSGRILDAGGKPLRNATIEIWQCDRNGAYLHTGSDNGNRRDGNFQGFGRFVTGSTGEYLFRTIKPVPYPGRTPHIHVQVKVPGHEKFTTQCYVRGEPGNAKDMLWSEIKDAKKRDAVTVAFAPLKGSRKGEHSARFDVVLGFTPEG